MGSGARAGKRGNTLRWLSEVEAIGRPQGAYVQQLARHPYCGRSVEVAELGHRVPKALVLQVSSLLASEHVAAPPASETVVRLSFPDPRPVRDVAPGAAGRPQLDDLIDVGVGQPGAVVVSGNELTGATDEDCFDHWRPGRLPSRRVPGCQQSSARAAAPGQSGRSPSRVRIRGRKRGGRCCTGWTTWHELLLAGRQSPLGRQDG